MRCFVFFLITWALVTSFPVEKEAQVNSISQYLHVRWVSHQGNICSKELFLGVFLMYTYDFFLFFNRMKIKGKTKILVGVAVGFSWHFQIQFQYLQNL